MAEEVAGSSPESPEIPEIPDGQVSVFQSLQAKDPAQLGGYTLVARLGAGGMGTVYLSHTRAGRPVAIKAIRPELADDPDFRRRFRQEVAAARRVHGLYTAPVIDSEIDTPPLWLATAFVQGPTLSAAVSRHGTLPLPSVLLLAAGVAEALEAVHGEGIVHRDLKASNVLLASDGPRVIDFGIARAIDATTLTSTGIAVGTPPFMSPEQALNKDVGPATDIFSLGQLVTYAAKGTPAFGEGQSYGVLFRIVYEEPELTGVPEALLPLLNRCLAKDPAERPSPADVIDLCRAASEDGMLRRTGNWLPETVTTDITRHQDVPQQRLGDSQLEGVSEIAADTAQPHTRTASPGPPAAAGSDTRASAAARAELEAGADHTRGANTGSGGPAPSPPPAPAPTDHSGTHGASLWVTEPPPQAPHRSVPPSPAADGDSHPPSVNTPQPDPKPIRRRALLTLGVTALAGAGGATAVISQKENGYAVKSTKRLVGHKSSITSAVFSPDGKTLATASQSEGNLFLWDTETYDHTKIPTGHKDGVHGVAFSPDSKTLATTGTVYDNDGTPTGRVAFLWDTGTRKRMKISADRKNNFSGVAFSPDGKTLATVDQSGGNLFLWDTETHDHTKIPTGHKSYDVTIAFSPDSKILATTDREDTKVFLWDMETRKRTKTLTGHESYDVTIAFSPDGKTLATAGREDATVLLWNAETREHIKTLPNPKKGATIVVFSPDSKTLAITGHEDANVFLWDTETHEHIKTLTGHNGGITNALFSPDGKTLVTARNRDGKVLLWDTETHEHTKTLTGHKESVLGVAFSPDGKTLVTAGWLEETARLWKASGNAPISAARIKKQS